MAFFHKKDIPVPSFFYVPAIRYVDDGRPFWQYIVSSSTGCSNLEYFEELYKYYTTEKVAQRIGIQV
ncbi:hypothetical protein BHE74_00057958 [Ensete ventricosum]|nr:hypothetical protein BHE74_00057958 [Ensete ventricosum]